jgi:hypothetical protein
MRTLLQASYGPMHEHTGETLLQDSDNTHLGMARER